MKYILVDYESVGTAGLEKLDQIENSDELVVIYSKNMPYVSIDLLNSVRDLGAGIFKKVLYTGENSLGNVLCMLVGQKMEAFAGSFLEVIVISTNKNYDILKERIESSTAGPRKAKTSYKRYPAIQDMIAGKENELPSIPMEPDEQSIEKQVNEQ